MPPPIKKWRGFFLPLNNLETVVVNLGNNNNNNRTTFALLNHGINANESDKFNNVNVLLMLLLLFPCFFWWFLVF